MTIILKKLESSEEMTSMGQCLLVSYFETVRRMLHVDVNTK